MNNSDKLSAFIRNSIIIVLLNICVIYAIGQFIDEYQINGYAENSRDSNFGVLLSILCLMSTSLIFAGLNSAEYFSFINNENEKSATISYVILGVITNLIGFTIIILLLHLMK